MSDTFDVRYEKDPSFVYREIGGEGILIPIRRRTADLQSIFTMNETGARIWSLVDGKRTLRDIRQAVESEYEVPVSELEADFEEFISKLIQLQAIQRIDA